MHRPPLLSAYNVLDTTSTNTHVRICYRHMSTRDSLGLEKPGPFDGTQTLGESRGCAFPNRARFLVEDSAMPLHIIHMRRHVKRACALTSGRAAFKCPTPPTLHEWMDVSVCVPTDKRWPSHACSKCPNYTGERWFMLATRFMCRTFCMITFLSFSILYVCGRK